MWPGTRPPKRAEPAPRLTSLCRSRRSSRRDRRLWGTVPSRRIKVPDHRRHETQQGEKPAIRTPIAHLRVGQMPPLLQCTSARSLDACALSRTLTHSALNSARNCGGRRARIATGSAAGATSPALGDGSAADCHVDAIVTGAAHQNPPSSNGVTDVWLRSWSPSNSGWKPEARGLHSPPQPVNPVDIAGEQVRFTWLGNLLCSLTKSGLPAVERRVCREIGGKEVAALEEARRCSTQARDAAVEVKVPAGCADDGPGQAGAVMDGIRLRSPAAGERGRVMG